MQAILGKDADVVSLVRRWLRHDLEGLAATNDDEMTALHLAASTNNTQVAAVLLEAGAGVYVHHTS